MKTYELQEEIEKLILSRREDDYWDFKEKHHSNTADLLHDIICMANSRADRDAYIIYGVVDKTGNVIGVESDPVFFARENSPLLQNIFPRHRWGIFCAHSLTER